MWYQLTCETEFNQVEKMRERLKTPEGLVWAVCDLRTE